MFILMLAFINFLDSYFHSRRYKNLCYLYISLNFIVSNKVFLKFADEIIIYILSIIFIGFLFKLHI